MAALSRYENAARAFLKAFPIGSDIAAEEMLDWAQEHADGLAADMLISEPGKRISSVRRHLNDGGASRNLAESDRFYIEWKDKEDKTFVILAFHAYQSDKADNALGAAMVGALRPFEKAQQGLKRIRPEDLDDETAKAIRQKMADIVENAKPLRDVFSQRWNQQCIGRLVAKGF